VRSLGLKVVEVKALLGVKYEFGSPGLQPAKGWSIAGNISAKYDSMPLGTLSIKQTDLIPDYTYVPNLIDPYIYYVDFNNPRDLSVKRNPDYVPSEAGPGPGMHPPGNYGALPQSTISFSSMQPTWADLREYGGNVWDTKQALLEGDLKAASWHKDHPTPTIGPRPYTPEERKRAENNGTSDLSGGEGLSQKVKDAALKAYGLAAAGNTTRPPSEGAQIAQREAALRAAYKPCPNAHTFPLKTVHQQRRLFVTP
jgi:hypothetical protein